MSTSFSPRRPSAAPSPNRSRTSSRAPSRIGSRRPSGASVGYDFATPASAADCVALLTDATNFQDLPSTDPLTSLLGRYVSEFEPAPYHSGDWRGRSLEEMVSTGSWRAVANYARDTLVSRTYTDIPDILELWHIRLHALLRLQLVTLHTRELVTLDRHLAGLPLEVTKHVPFEVDVFRAKMQDLGKTTVMQGGGSAGAGGGARGVPLYVLLRKCQALARAEVEGREKKIWCERVVKVGMMIVGSLIERKEYVPALGMLDGISHSISSGDDDNDDGSLFQHAATQIQIVRFLIHLSLGTIHHAQGLFQGISNDTSVSEVVKHVLSGLLRTCQGRSGSPVPGHTLSATEEKEGGVKLDMVVANNEAVALLANGELSSAVARLGTAMTKHEPDCYSEPYIFNLATLYELDGGSALQNKVKVLENAVRASGQVIKPGAFKLV